MEEEEEGTAQKVSITKETPITLKTLQNVEQLKERYTDYKKGMEIFAEESPILDKSPPVSKEPQLTSTPTDQKVSSIFFITNL